MLLLFMWTSFFAFNVQICKHCLSFKLVVTHALLNQYAWWVAHIQIFAFASNSLQFTYTYKYALVSSPWLVHVGWHAPFCWLWTRRVPWSSPWLTLTILFVKNEKVAKMVISRSLSFSSYNHTFMANLPKPRPKKNAQAHGKLWRNMKGRKLAHNCEYNMRT